MSDSFPPPPGTTAPPAGGADDEPQRSGADLARRALAEARAAARERGATPAPHRRRGRPQVTRSRTEPQTFDAAVRAWLIEHGWQDQVAIGGVFGRWEQIVGERLAAHVRPERVEDGELVVAADSPSWATQVRALAPQLLRRLNGELGEGAVRSVRVRGPGGTRRQRFR